MIITLWLVRQTEKARLYCKVRPDRNPTKADQVWVPLSVIMHTSKRGDEHDVSLPDWFIEKNGL